MLGGDQFGERAAIAIDQFTQLNMTSAGLDSGVACRAGKAALAVATTASVSALPAKGTCACSYPVAGFHTPPLRDDDHGTGLPLMK